MSKYQNDPFEYAQKYSELFLQDLECLELKYVTELIKRHASGNLALDCGCGPGQTTLYLKSLGFDAEGVDVNPHMLKIAQQNDPSGKYQLCKSAEIPKEDNHYDLVYSSWALVHAETKEELLENCKEIYRVLKTGGIFVLVVNSDEHYNRDWLTVDTKLEINENLRSGSIMAAKFKGNNFVAYGYYWTERDYTEALTTSGLTVLNIVKPTGIDGDGNQTNIPYVTIFVTQKL